MKKSLILLSIAIFLGSMTVFAANSIFSDVPSDEWYSDAVNSLENKGIVEGYSDGTFRPSNNINRAEMAAIIDNLIQYFVENGMEDYYISEKFGLKFIKTNIYDFSEYSFRESENGLGFEEFGDRIKVFYKEKDQSIEDAILDLIASEGKNPDDCVIERTDSGYGTMNGHYKIDLVDQNIVYTEEELQRIADADVDANSDGGPFNGDWMKHKIYNERLIEACTEYADPAGLGTSTSHGSSFEYNEYRANDRFIFLEESADPEFYERGSIEFIRL